MTLKRTYLPDTTGGSGGGPHTHPESDVTSLADDLAAKAAKASNLSDLTSASTARTNLGLGGAATLAVGTTTGTVAAGDDSRITGAAVKLTVTAVKTSAYAAAANEFVPVDTTSGSVTVTFPSAAADGARVGVKHVVRGGTNTVGLALTGSDVFNTAGGATTGTLTLLNQAVVFQYRASGAIWYATGDDIPLSQLDGRFVPKTGFMRNALDYGIVADGSRTDPTVGTNNASAMTTALASAAAAGETLYFPRGVYRLTGSVTLPAGGNFGIQGDGRHDTLFQLDGTSNASTIFNLSNVATSNPNVTLHGFALDGDKSHATARGAVGINLRCCDNLDVSDVEVRNVGGKGIQHQGDAGLAVTEIQTWRRVYVHDCDGFFGIQATLRTRKTTWDEIYVENNTGVGIYLDVSEMLVRSIHAEGNYSHGIFIHNVYMCSFTGLHATRNGGSGIVVLGMVESLGGNWLAENNGKNFVNGTLAASPSSGATSISVTAGSNPVPLAGQFLTIGAVGFQETVHVKTVTGSGPYTCTLFAATTAAHTSGDAVLSGRSAESDPVPTVCADVYFDSDNTQNYGVTKRSVITGICAGYTSIGAEGVKADYSLYMEDGVNTDVRILGVTYPAAGRTGTWRLPATLGTLVYQHAPVGGTMIWEAGGPPVVSPTSAVPADHGYLGWTLDPLLASTTLVMASGTLYLIRCRVQTTGALSTVSLPITTAATAVTLSKVAIFDITGATRLGVSADQGTSWQTGSSVKVISLSSPTAVQEAGTVVLVAALVVGTTGPTIRTSVTAAGLNIGLTASSPGRAATLASQTDMPTSVTLSGTTLATQVPLLALA